jgi:glycosyltransferase involved in cell wall biosynthesis
VIAGRDFIVLSDDWNGLPTSAIHLFKRLASTNRVFWFNTVGRMPRPSLADARKVISTLGGWAVKRIQPRTKIAAGTPQNLHVASPMMLPWFKPAIRRFNQASMFRKYERLRAEHGIVDPIVITTFPYNVDFLKRVPGGLKLYYCVDDFLDYPGVNHADWAVMEADLVRSVDGIVVTSRDLERKRTQNCPLLHLPHGTDFEHFHDAVVRSEPEPRMESIKHPIVGFFGLISEWVDRELISRLSEAFPDSSFVLLGRAEAQLGRLATQPNVHNLGWVPYAELPRYARYFDVGLIPFVLNQLTRAVNPLKLMEYFALGLPVLATRLPELESIPGPLHLAETVDEFQAGLAVILAGDPKSMAEAAICVARENTWEARVEQLSEFIEEFTAVGV